LLPEHLDEVVHGDGGLLGDVLEGVMTLYQPAGDNTENSSM
jgi:hypothetical protein